MLKKRFMGVVIVSIMLMAAIAPGLTNAQDPVTIRWYVGLGTGGNAEQVAAQEALVEEFNATHPNINLEIEIVDNDQAYDQLKTYLSAGEAPDIVGPVGIRGSNEFDGLWLDLQPIVDETGYDLSQWSQSLVDFYRVEGQGLVGLPFAVYPQIFYYNRDLFDEAGLEYPPHAFGEPYADGEPWDFEKVRELGMYLTVDANGNDATSEEFDPENIVQFGFVDQWMTDTRRVGTMFGAGSIIDEEGNAVMPEQWRAAINWLYNGIWVDHFMPSNAYLQSDLLAADNAFSSGNVAMAQTFTWYTCCIDAAVNWDIAVVPSYNGTTTAALHADTFRVLASTEHPAEAFEVLTYLVGEGSLPLLTAYGALPSRVEDQEAYFAAQEEKYVQGVDWNVIVESLAYPDIPSHEANMPNFAKADDLLGSAFPSLFRTDGSLDINAEIDNMLADLQLIFDEVQ